MHINSRSKQNEKGKVFVKPSSPLDDSSSDDNSRMVCGNKQLRMGKVVAEYSSPLGFSWDDVARIVRNKAHNYKAKGKSWSSHLCEQEYEEIAESSSSQLPEWVIWENTPREVG